MGDAASISALCTTAAVVAVVHTLAGPDHYLPFVAMSRVGKWSLPRTMIITVLCGLGHVLSSVVIGSLGIALGWSLTLIEAFEGARGEIAAWLLLGFGIAYAAWGVRHALRRREHAHVHFHADGTRHSHEHTHHHGHAHVHIDESRAGQMTPWILFTIFVFGPCEVLIPLLMFPAAQLSVWGIALVATIFGICTISTMVVVVACGYKGMEKLPLARFANYSHAAAGFALAACGAAIKLGL